MLNIVDKTSIPHRETARNIKRSDFKVFYVKRKGKRIPVEYPFFTTCPMCGAEHEVDLVDIILQTDGNLYSTAVFCERCTQKRALARAGANHGKEVQTCG